MLNVTVDTELINAVLENIKAPKVNGVLARALADTQKNAAVKAAQEINKRAGFRNYRKVRDGIKTPFVSEANLVADIGADRRGVPLIDFPSTADQRPGGVFTRAWKRPVTIRSGFITNVGPTRHVFVRQGPERLPLRKMWGPNIWGTFLNAPEVRAAINTRIKQQLPRNIVRRAISAIRRRGGL